MLVTKENRVVLDVALVPCLVKCAVLSRLASSLLCRDHVDIPLVARIRLLLGRTPAHVNAAG